MENGVYNIHLGQTPDGDSASFQFDFTGFSLREGVDYVAPGNWLCRIVGATIETNRNKDRRNIVIELQVLSHPLFGGRTLKRYIGLPVWDGTSDVNADTPAARAFRANMEKLMELYVCCQSFLGLDAPTGVQNVELRWLVGKEVGVRVEDRESTYKKQNGEEVTSVMSDVRFFLSRERLEKSCGPDDVRHDGNRPMPKGAGGGMKAASLPGMQRVIQPSMPMANVPMPGGAPLSKQAGLPGNMQLQQSPSVPGLQASSPSMNLQQFAPMSQQAPQQALPQVPQQTTQQAQGNVQVPPPPNGIGAMALPGGGIPQR